MAVAMGETGGDPGHAAARRVYEKHRFRLLPIAGYFKTVQVATINTRRMLLQVAPPAAA